MKTISTLFTFFFMSFAVVAAETKTRSMLTVQSAGGADIVVVLDGKRFEPRGNSLVIQDIHAGRHTIKIYRERNKGVFSVLGKKYDMVYNTSLQLSNRTHLKINIDRNGYASVAETKLILQNGKGWGHDVPFDYNRDGTWNDYDYDRGNARARAMSDGEFRNVLQAISREWLESNKLKSAVQIVKNNYLSTVQVREMLLLFGFENNRLELAKQAYLNTVDRRNYSDLYTLFSFNSNRLELERYIRSVR